MFQIRRFKFQNVQKNKLYHLGSLYSSFEITFFWILKNS